MELIAVVLGSPTSKERFNTAKALLNYGFGAYALADVTPEQPLPALPVQLGQAEQVELALAQTGKLLVKKEERSKVTQRIAVGASVEGASEPGTGSGQAGGVRRRQGANDHSGGDPDPGAAADLFWDVRQPVAADGDREMRRKYETGRNPSAGSFSNRMSGEKWQNCRCFFHRSMIKFS